MNVGSSLGPMKLSQGGVESRGSFGLLFLEPIARCMSTLGYVHYNSIMDQGMWSWLVVSVHGASTCVYQACYSILRIQKKNKTWSLSSCTSWCSGGNRHKQITVIQCDVSPDARMQRVVGGITECQSGSPFPLFKDSVVSIRL